MKKIIALATVAALVVTTPALAGGYGSYRDHGPLVNVDVSDVDVLDDAQFLNGIYVGNNASVLSGILSGNNVLNGSPILNGNNSSILSGIGLFSNNKRGGRRW